MEIEKVSSNGPEGGSAARVLNGSPPDDIRGCKPEDISLRGFRTFPVSFSLRGNIIQCFLDLISAGNYADGGWGFRNVVMPHLEKAVEGMSECEGSWDIQSHLEMLALTPGLVGFYEAREAYRLAGYRSPSVFELLAFGAQHSWVQKYYSLGTAITIRQDDPRAPEGFNLRVPYLWGTPGMELGDTVSGSRCLDLSYTTCHYNTRDEPMCTRKRFLGVYDPEVALKASPDATMFGDLSKVLSVGVIDLVPWAGEIMEVVEGEVV